MVSGSRSEITGQRLFTLVNIRGIKFANSRL